MLSGRLSAWPLALLHQGSNELHVATICHWEHGRQAIYLSGSEYNYTYIIHIYLFKMMSKQ